MPCTPLSNIRVSTCKEDDIVFDKKRYDGSGNGRLESSARPCCSSHPIKNDLVLTFIRKRSIFTNTAVRVSRQMRGVLIHASEKVVL